MAIPLLSKLLSAAWRARNSTTQHNQPNLEKTLEPTSSNIDSPYKIDNSPALPIHHRPGVTPDATTTLPPATLTNPARQCPLCLSPRGVAPESGGTCVTECGHVFCWGCIQEWGHEKVGSFLFFIFCNEKWDGQLMCAVVEGVPVV
jgi:peroxin-10